MPFYDYKCPRCGDRSTRKVPVDDRDDQRCCAGEMTALCGAKLERQLSAPGVVFKGDGWTPRYHR